MNYVDASTASYMYLEDRFCKASMKAIGRGMHNWTVFNQSQVRGSVVLYHLLTTIFVSGVFGYKDTFMRIITSYTTLVDGTNELFIVYPLVHGQSNQILLPNILLLYGIIYI